MTGWLLLDFEAAGLVEDFLGVLHRKKMLLLLVKEGIRLCKTHGHGTFTTKALAGHVLLGERVHVVALVLGAALDCVCGTETLLNVGGGGFEAARIKGGFVSALQRLAFIH